jgi:hypothetical protein
MVNFYRAMFSIYLVQRGGGVAEVLALSDPAGRQAVIVGQLVRGDGRWRREVGR